MIFYTVHEPPDPPVDRVERAASLCFIGDRFSPLALVLGPIWLLVNGVWIGLALYLAAAGAIAAVVLGGGFGLGWLPLMLVALNLIVGFEAPSLLRWSLERRGWRTLGTVSGRSEDECERRFLDTWLPDQRLGETRLSRQEEFVATVNALRAGGSGGLATAGATGAGSAGGRLDTGRSRGGGGWRPWRRNA